MSTSSLPSGITACCWHERVNRYFVEHDPYRHPTTASKAGDAWWPAGYAVTDVPQMHSYDSQHDPVYTVRPFDTWQGIYLDESQATADRSGRMTVILPPFTRDIAVRLNH